MRRIMMMIVVFTTIPLHSLMAHSGRTDRNGGHYLRSLGVYHYHSNPDIEAKETVLYAELETMPMETCEEKKAVYKKIEDFYAANYPPDIDTTTAKELGTFAAMDPECDRTPGSFRFDSIKQDYLDVSTTAFNTEVITVMARGFIPTYSDSNSFILSRANTKPGTVNMNITASNHATPHHLTCQIRLDGDENTQRQIYSNSPMPENQWFQGACVYDGQKLVLYVNGEIQDDVLIASGTLDTDNFQAFWIGENPNLNDVYWNGNLSDVRIYGRALTAEEISVSYGCANKPSDQLLARWSLDETLKDLTMNGNDASCVNCPSFETKLPILTGCP